MRMMAEALVASAGSIPAFCMPNPTDAGKKMRIKGCCAADQARVSSRASRVGEAARCTLTESQTSVRTLGMAPASAILSIAEACTAQRAAKAKKTRTKAVKGGGRTWAPRMVRPQVRFPLSHSAQSGSCSSHVEFAQSRSSPRSRACVCCTGADSSLAGTGTVTVSLSLLPVWSITPGCSNCLCVHDEHDASAQSGATDSPRGCRPPATARRPAPPRRRSCARAPC